jgi:hypothetical protein
VGWAGLVWLGSLPLRQVFTNWFSDDWMTRVYGFEATSLLRHQKVRLSAWLSS